MKNLFRISYILVLLFTFVACDHEENEVLPDFLDGTEYGILLHVGVTSATSINITDVQTASVDFEVSFEGDQRPVESITVNKIFSSADGNITSGELAQTTLTSFPTSVSLSVNDLVNGVTGLSIDNLMAGDVFQIKFVIKYVDGKTVSRYGTRLNPNFSVTFE